METGMLIADMLNLCNIFLGILAEKNGIPTLTSHFRTVTEPPDPILQD